MKHRFTRDLYGYWNKSRGRCPAPERADIDPTAIPQLLADTFLLGFDDGSDPAFRLAGTRVCALFCRELKGEGFVGLFGPGSQDAVRDLVAVVCDDVVATVAGVTAHLGDGTSETLELLLLPLQHRGRTDSRLLGMLIPVTTPLWLGAMPVEALTLGTQRHMGAFVDAPRPSGLPSVMPAGRLRHGLVVYDGGRN